MKKTKTQDGLHAGWVGRRKDFPAGSMIFGTGAGSRGELDAATRKLDPEGAVRARLQAQNVANEIGAYRDCQKSDEEDE